MTGHLTARCMAQHWRSAGNSNIYGLAGDFKIRELTGAAHSIRMDDERSQKKVLNGKFHNSRSVGKARTRWRDVALRNRRMGDTSWGRPGPRRGCAIAAHIYQCQRKQLASPACQASLSATDRSVCHLAAPRRAAGAALFTLWGPDLLTSGGPVLGARNTAPRRQLCLPHTSENDCKPTERIYCQQ